MLDTKVVRGVRVGLLDLSLHKSEGTEDDVDKI